MRKTIIITAGGIGKRMGSAVPKQFLLIKGKPILWLTLKQFIDYDSTAQIVLTLPEEWIQFWSELLIEHGHLKHMIVSGGVERYDSIKNALNKIDTDLIAVHDGVRPFVSHETIERCFNVAQKHGAGIPVLPLKESLRKKTTEDSTAMIRSEFCTVQTPQCFKAEILNNAYSIPFDNTITDDASLVERSGIKIHLCDGNEENIKITSPIDLKLAEILATTL